MATISPSGNVDLPAVCTDPCPKVIPLFSDEVRRSPFALYDRFRSTSPLLHHAESDLRLIFDYAGVKQVFTDHETFTRRHGPADWVIFQDPPRQTKLRALISK